MACILLVGAQHTASLLDEEHNLTGSGRLSRAQPYKVASSCKSLIIFSSCAFAWSRCTSVS
jgi:hypothetical protein